MLRVSKGGRVDAPRAGARAALSTPLLPREVVEVAAIHWGG